MRKEVLPIACLSLSLIVGFKYKREIENSLSFLQTNVITPGTERFVAKKLAGLMDSKHKYGKIPLADDLIDV